MKNYNRSFRPASYWDGGAPAAYFLSSIKGEARRQDVKRLVAQGKAEDIPEFLLSESLSDDERRIVGRIHPMLMGGEYLPDLKGEAEQVEIARICLRSVTADVYSIRARRENGTIRYCMVDEYETEYPEWDALTTTEPLTFGELLDVLGHWQNPRDYNWDTVDHDREQLGELRKYVYASSEFYPQLATWFDDEANEWYAAHLADIDDEDKEPLEAGIQ